MGTSISKAPPLAPTFERMATWDLKSSRRLLQDYKDKDLDFGLDAQGLADLLGGDKDWAESIIDAFSSPTGIINALAFICGVCLVCSGPALEKAGMIFDALDFDGTEQISMDEMTISFLCSTRGFCVITGVGAVPSDEELESVTLQAYRDLNKGSTQSITKAEFMKWIIEFASGTGAPPTREVTLQNALEQFGVVPLSENTEEKEENNASTPLQDDSEEDGAEYPSEAGQNDDENLVDPLHQGTDMPNAGEFTVGQEHDSIEHATELIESEYVATELDRQLPSDGDGIAHGYNEFNLVESATGVNDGQTEADVESVAQMDETQEAPETEQIANDNNEPGFETENHLKAAADESDYPTFVADGDELPHRSESFTNEEHDQIASGQELNSDFDAATFETGAGLDVQEDNAHFESQDTEPVAAPEGLVTGESPPEPTSTDDDDLLYEQDDFAQETPRAEREAEPVDETYPADKLEDASPKDATEEPEPATTEGDTEVIAAEEVVEHDVEVDETPPPAPLPDQEPAETTVTLENTDTTEEGATEAPVDEAAAVDEVTATDPDPAEETSATDMNAYDTYDYEQPQFDGSSGLPPPEPQELIDDAAVEAAQEAADAPEENPAE